MEGGRLLGQGTYGCVFTPPLLCKNEKRLFGKGDLGKISRIEDVTPEIQAAKDLVTDPRSKTYFLLPQADTVCKPAPADKQPDPDIKKCEPLQRWGEKDMVHYRMRYGGQSLYVILSSDQFSPKTFPFFRFMKEILEGGSVLLLNGYVHGDLHEQNILLDKRFHPRVIDFGRAFSVKRLSQQTIDESWTQYDASFAPESPEMALAIAAVSDVPFGQAIEDMRNEKAGILNAERILGVPRAHQIQELVEFWRGSKAAQAGDWLKFWRLYWPAMDSWSFGTMLLSMYKRLLLSKSFTDSEEWTNKHHIVETVLRGLLHSSPRKRFDCVEALAVYDPLNGLVTRGAGKKWLTALRKQTRN